MAVVWELDSVMSISDIVTKPPSGDVSVRDLMLAPPNPCGIHVITAAGLLLDVVQVKVRVSPALASRVPVMVADVGATAKTKHFNIYSKSRIAEIHKHLKL